jgi:anti-sigma B factor antagonist
LNSHEFASSSDDRNNPIANGFDPRIHTDLTFGRIDKGDETVLSIEGTFDAQSAPQVRGALDALVAEQRLEVAVDLSSLTSIDSSGIGAVVSLYKRVRAQGGRVYVKGLRGQPLAIFRLLRLDRVLVS